MADAHRYCEYRECGVCIDDMRPQARYCHPIHKAAEHRLRRLEPLGTTYPVGKPYQAVRRQRRRPTRKGLGTRLYAVRSELAALELDFSPSTPEGEHFMEKVRQASERLEGRAA
jgi:hypothetical protein